MEELLEWCMIVMISRFFERGVFLYRRYLKLGYTLKSYSENFPECFSGSSSVAPLRYRDTKLSSSTFVAATRLIFQIKKDWIRKE